MPRRMIETNITEEDIKLEGSAGRILSVETDSELMEIRKQKSCLKHMFGYGMINIS